MENAPVNRPVYSSGSEIPPPVIFNCWKHHKLFIQSEIKRLAAIGEEGISEVRKSILSIGESQIDLYIGELSLLKIINEITQKLKEMRVYEIQQYCNWIGKVKDAYKLLILSDESTWTLRIGVQENRYIHIHPGRHTKHSIRLRSHTLKTAILTILLSGITNTSPYQISLINSVRKDYLDLAPVKSVEKAFGLTHIISELMS